MKIYVASSWRNEHQQEVVMALRDEGFDSDGEPELMYRMIDKLCTNLPDLLATMKSYYKNAAARIAGKGTP